MKKHLACKLLFLFCLAFLFFKCKKYPDGGFLARAKKNILTPKNCPWQIKLFEVNGIDSTYLLNYGYDKDYFYRLTMTVDWVDDETKKEYYFVTASEYRYYGHFVEDKRKILLENDWGNSPGPGYAREILNPEADTIIEWEIIRLKKDFLEIKHSGVNTYRLKFEKHEI